MIRGQYQPPVRLEKGHQTTAFDCGVSELDEYLKKFALGNQSANAARTYVVRSIESEKIAGYYTLAYGSIEIENSPDRLRKGLARHPIPMMLLARLAIDSEHQKRGLGAALLLDACRRTLQAADIGGLRALVVDAKDAVAADFYRRYDFVSFGDSNPSRLYVLISDLRKSIG
jgi:GNAT superfamily N-acetyltransferase